VPQKGEARVKDGSVDNLEDECRSQVSGGTELRGRLEGHP